MKVSAKIYELIVPDQQDCKTNQNGMNGVRCEIYVHFLLDMLRTTTTIGNRR